jgi:hypothetical protein
MPTMSQWVTWHQGRSPCSYIGSRRGKVEPPRVKPPFPSSTWVKRESRAQKITYSCAVDIWLRSLYSKINWCVVRVDTSLLMGYAPWVGWPSNLVLVSIWEVSNSSLGRDTNNPIVECVPVARQQPRNKQVYNGRY